MKNLSKENIKQTIIIILIVACMAVGILCLLLKVWVMVEYGDVPLSDVPSWVLPWLN